jgi:hypothetical protein
MRLTANRPVGKFTLRRPHGGEWKIFSDEEVYHALSAYTLELRDPEFLHQHVVDAYTVQHANETSKPIGVLFALAGLYLHVERQLTGRQVQRAHMQLAKDRRPWPRVSLPTDRGAMTAVDVMAMPEGAQRDEAIHAWCRSVWDACEQTRDGVILILGQHGII